MIFGKYSNRNRVEHEGQTIVRKYTPILVDRPGKYFDLLVKCYPDGIVSKSLHKLENGDVAMITSPVGRFTFEPGKWKRIQWMILEYSIQSRPTDSEDHPIG
jgi:ferredoxin-NADP reductase